MRRILPIVLTALALLAAGGATTPVAAEPSATEASGAEAALTGVGQIEAGDEHTCAVVTGGQVRCWGYNFFRELGNGNTVASGFPTAVLTPSGAGNLTGVTQVSAGANHSCARLSSGQARCWGYNGDGQLGVGDTAAQTLPVVVKGPGGTGRLTGVAQVAAGTKHSCARVTGGQVRCWGLNADGQLGIDSLAPSTTPVVVLAPTGSGPLTGVTQLAVGQNFNCARRSTGQVVCWGNNSSAQLGDGSTADRDRPVFVRNADNSGRLTGVRQVAVSRFYACALLTNGQARCWGFGFGPFPLAVLKADNTPLTGITSISAGADHLCFRLSNGRLRCRGANAQGQLGDLTNTARATPVPMVNTAGTSAATGVTAVAAGARHTCARLGTTQVICTGANDFGQLGAGPGPATARPIGVRR